MAAKTSSTHILDVHRVGENPINTSHAFHAQSMYAPRPYISHGSRR
jgi:hypothetical protein